MFGWVPGSEAIEEKVSMRGQYGENIAKKGIKWKWVVTAKGNGWMRSVGKTKGMEGVQRRMFFSNIEQAT